MGFNSAFKGLMICLIVFLFTVYSTTEPVLQQIRNSLKFLMHCGNCVPSKTRGSASRTGDVASFDMIHTHTHTHENYLAVEQNKHSLLSMTPRSFVSFVPAIAQIKAPSAGRPRQTMIYPLVHTYPLIPLHKAHREPVSGLSSKVQSRSAHYVSAINTAEAFFNDTFNSCHLPLTAQA